MTAVRLQLRTGLRRTGKHSREAWSAFGSGLGEPRDRPSFPPANGAQTPHMFLGARPVHVHWAVVRLDSNPPSPVLAAGLSEPFSQGLILVWSSLNSGHGPLLAHSCLPRRRSDRRLPAQPPSSSTDLNLSTCFLVVPFCLFPLGHKVLEEEDLYCSTGWMLSK